MGTLTEKRMTGYIENGEGRESRPNLLGRTRWAGKPRGKGGKIDHHKTRMLPLSGSRSAGEVLRVSTAKNGPLAANYLVTARYRCVAPFIHRF
jgi:hypothetical protein